MEPAPTDVTLLLKQLSAGDHDAVDQLVPVLYNELRRLAAYYLRQERSNHTLQATALVHEAYLRLVDQRAVEWKNRSHFFGVAAQVMRRILLDYARSHQAVKRGGPSPKISLDDAMVYGEDQTGQLVALDELLTRLSSMDPQQGRIVELRFFGGMSVEETAELLGISPRTVKRDWAMAKSWLSRELRKASREEAAGNQSPI
ncbi:MAG: RNA polymerase subunit sigma-70 [Acidobacteria bacterium]|nr:MAG: RNA polymerase subunit sigma-70 [Acidobacteriota bacterium]